MLLSRSCWTLSCTVRVYSVKFNDFCSWHICLLVLFYNSAAFKMKCTFRWVVVVVAVADSCGSGSSSSSSISIWCQPCVAVSEADSVVKVAEWQQTYYASDSGIQSGATTARDDESSTEYSGRKKYTGSTTTSTAPAAAGGGDAAAAGALESPTGEAFSWFQVLWCVVFRVPPFICGILSLNMKKLCVALLPANHLKTKTEASPPSNNPNHEHAVKSSSSI